MFSEDFTMTWLSPYLREARFQAQWRDHCELIVFFAIPGSSWRLVPRARLVSAHLCGARYQGKWRDHFGLIVFMLPGSSWEVVISAFRSKVT